MKKAMLLICGVIFFVGCANKIDPTPGEKCKPKWYKKDFGDGVKIVYGYSVEKSRSASLASSLGLASAQSQALTQVNNHINNEVAKAIDEKTQLSGGERAEDYTQAAYERLKINTNEACRFCVIIDSDECEDDGYLVVYTKVQVDIEKYLNQDFQAKMDKLLEKPEALLKELKEN